MKGATVCSGIGAPEVAMPQVDWLFAAEIEAAPRAIYSHRHPNTELFGDFTAMKDDPRIVDIELLVGGTPCQSFSIAGLRNSLSDDRGNLALEFIRLANAIDDLRRADGRNDAFILWENVPGVLSVNDNAFGAFLGGLVGSDAPLVPNGKWTNAGVVVGPRRVAAWRVLDAQFFGVPQRRRRVFVLANGHSRGWACADALLSIGHSLSGHSAPRREKGQTAPTIPSRSTGGGGLGTDFDCDGGLIAFNSREDCCSSERVFGSLGSASPQAAAIAFNITPSNSNKDFNARVSDRAQALTAGGNRPSARGGDVIAIQERAISENVDAGPDGAGFRDDGNAYTLEARTVPQAVAFDMRGREGGAQFEGPHDSANLRAASGGSSRSYVAASAVRRLTPTECERLQGFPDDFTLVPHRGKPMADGPRYKALGNSMAVPVLRWIGERIEMVEQLEARRAA